MQCTSGLQSLILEALRAQALHSYGTTAQVGDLGFLQGLGCTLLHSLRRYTKTLCYGCYIEFHCLMWLFLVTRLPVVERA